MLWYFHTTTRFCQTKRKREKKIVCNAWHSVQEFLASTYLGYMRDRFPTGIFLLHDIPGIVHLIRALECSGISREHLRQSSDFLIKMTTDVGHGGNENLKSLAKLKLYDKNVNML